MCSPLSSCVTPEMINAPFSLGRPHIARELFEETMIKNTKVFAIIDQRLQTLPDPLCVAGRQDPSLDRCLCLQGLAGTYADELVWEKASTLIAAAVAQLDALPDRDSREMVIVRRQLRVDEAWIYCCNNRNSAAVRILKDVLDEIQRESKVSSELARTLMVYGRVLWVNGKQWESEKQYLEARMRPRSRCLEAHDHALLQAVSIFEQVSGERGENTCIGLYNLAYAQVMLGKLTHAFRSAEQARDIADEVQNHPPATAFELT